MGGQSSFGKRQGKRRGAALAVLLAAAVLFALGRLLAAPPEQTDSNPEEYAEYEAAVVRQILTDSTEYDPVSTGYRGQQLLLAEVTSGQYKGQTMQVYNYVGPLYGVPVEEGDRVTLIISTYADGTHTGTVYEYNRTPALALVVGLFLAAAILIGGKTGAKSLVGLGITLACMFWVLIPLLLKGLPTIPTVLAVGIYITVVSLTILGGVQKKTLCAMAGTAAGMALALGFGLLAQHLTRIDGLRISDVEPLLQLRQQGSQIGLRGLLMAGVVISSLGAAMDVTMGITSAMAEVRAADPDMSAKALFRSGMNVGRDMVGTMTNTLILAFLGSSFTLILYFYTIGLSFHQLFSSAYLSVEVISSVSCSIGVILTIPITALISAAVMTDGTKKTSLG